MRRRLLSSLVAALLLGGWTACVAQEAPAVVQEAPAVAQVAPAVGLKPLVTISFSGYGELKADIEFVGKLGDNAQLAQGLEGMLKLMTQGQGLAGLDTTKPWGAIIQTDGQEQFPVHGFIPVTNLKQLIGAIANLLPSGPPAEPADGVYELDLGGPTVFVQEKGGWAYITSSREALGNVPADPQQLLGGLHPKYDLAVRASIQNVPPMFRQMLLAQMQAGAEMGMERLPGESDDDYALRQGVAKQMLQQAGTAINDLDEVLIGWAVDRQTGTSYLDFQVTAVAGTKTAAQFTQAAAAKTNFAGFDLPGAALTGNWAGELTDNDVTETKGAITNLRAAAMKELKNTGLSADELQLATQLLSDMLEVLEKTIEGKTVDGGLALLLKPGALTVVAGGTIADGAKLEKALKQLAAEAQKEQPDLAKLLKFDAETHQGVRFHTLAVPTKEMGDETAVKLFGDQLDVVLGISDTSVYLSAGRDAASTLKQVIDQSKTQAGKQVPPLRIALAATPIAKFVADVADDEKGKQMATAIGAMLEQSGGKDHLTITSKPVPNGATARVEIEEGVLKLIGSLGQMMGGGMAAPGGPGTPGAAPPPSNSSF